jgi:hypothetical protein
MKGRRSVAMSGLFGLFVVHACLWAKGDMVLIEIKGRTLIEPIKVTDPKIEQFSVWAGPGVNGAGLEEATGFIVDWQKGVQAQPPAGLQTYELSFYVGCRTIPDDPRCMAAPHQLAYVVSYGYDPSSKLGFVYIPGTGEASYSLNTGTIWHGHGVEGHWFLASDSWEGFVQPLIASALSRSGGK